MKSYSIHVLAGDNHNASISEFRINSQYTQLLKTATLFLVRQNWLLQFRSGHRWDLLTEDSLDLRTTQTTASYLVPYKHTASSRPGLSSQDLEQREGRAHGICRLASLQEMPVRRPLLQSYTFALAVAMGSVWLYPAPLSQLWSVCRRHSVLP